MLSEYFQFLGEAGLRRRIDDAITVNDLWRLFLRRVPPVVAEYFRGGADQEITLRGNVMAFQQAMTTAFGALKFEKLRLDTTAADHNLSVPWFICPIGSLRALWPKAEAIAARVAGEAGTAMTLSTLTGTAMEEVKSASTGPCWFQLYLCGGRDAALRGIERAKRAGFSGLMLTIDTGVAGNRTEHARMKPMAALGTLSGLSGREQRTLLCAKLRLAPQMLRHASWLRSHLADGGMFQFVNIQLDERGTPMPYADIGKQLAASAVTWNDLGWIREAWGDGPLIVKGVHNAEDAKRAEQYGARAVVWSNHGGRQEDRVPPALHIVSMEMPKMKGSKMDFFMDGGIRNGKDILVALTYGLNAVGLGRVCIAGLGAGGYHGLRRALDIVHSEFERSMRLVGVESVAEIRQRGEELRAGNFLTGDSQLPPFLF